MRRDVALALLRPLEAALRGQGVSALHPLSSVAGDEAGATFDVGLPRDVRFSLFDQSRLQAHLADVLRVEVDVVPVGALRPLSSPGTRRTRVQAF